MRLQVRWRQLLRPHYTLGNVKQTIPVAMAGGKLLVSGLGALPLATLTDDATGSLSTVIRRIDARLQSEASGREREHLMAATTLLMGLRHTKDRIREALKGASNMWNSVLEDSSVVQDWLSRAKEEGKIAGIAEGKVEVAREFLFRQGSAKFGPPDSDAVAFINNASDIEMLERLGVRLLTANSWGELIAP